MQKAAAWSKGKASSIGCAMLLTQLPTRRRSSTDYRCVNNITHECAYVHATSICAPFCSFFLIFHIRERKRKIEELGKNTFLKFHSQCTHARNNVRHTFFFFCVFFPSFLPSFLFSLSILLPYPFCFFSILFIAVLLPLLLFFRLLSSFLFISVSPKISLYILSLKVSCIVVVSMQFILHAIIFYRTSVPFFLLSKKQ